MNGEPYRYCCARCGSHTVRKKPNGGFACNGKKAHRDTPAVWDKKTERWIHVGRTENDGTVPQHPESPRKERSYFAPRHNQAEKREFAYEVGGPSNNPHFDNEGGWGDVEYYK